MKVLIYIFLHLTVIPALISGELWSQDSGANRQWLRLELANDILFQTDKYYTNGLNLAYLTEKEFTPQRIIHFLHGSAVISISSYSLRQEIFTPEKRKPGEYDGTDRPFAAYLLLGSRKTSLNPGNQLRITSQMEIGLLGKYAGGEYIQNAVHGALPSSGYVYGWDEQINSDIALNYGIELEKGLFDYRVIGMSGHVSALAGLPYTGLGSGIILRAGDYSDYFLNLGLYSHENLKFYAYTGLDLNIILHNATIQGGWLNPGRPAEYPSINSTVLRWKNGFNVSYKRLNFEIGMEQVTPEFKGGTIHRWGFFAFTLQL